MASHHHPLPEEPGREPVPLPQVGECGKRVYRSERAARAANRHARFRLRAYWCDGCAGYHVTNGEKR